MASLAATRVELGPEPKLERGVYQLNGVLRRGNSGYFVVVLRDQSSAPYELIVLGGDVKEKFGLLGTRVSMEVCVPEEIKNNNHPMTNLRKVLERHAIPPDELIRISDESC